MAVPIVTWEQYAADWSGLHGGVDLRRVRPGVRRWLWLGFVIARSLQRIRVPAGAVTALGLLSSVMVAVVVTHGSGGILLAALLVFLATLADTVDGALAVLSGHTTRLGYVYDAVVDRIGEACWLIALWRIGAAGHVVVAAGALAWLHEYIRSRGNAAGMTEITAVTVGERPTRVMLTIGGLVLAGCAETFNPHIAAGIAAFTTAAWIVLGLIGITQLLAAVHRALAGRRWPTWRPPGTPNAMPPSGPPAAPPSGPPAPSPSGSAPPSPSGAPAPSPSGSAPPSPSPAPMPVTASATAGPATRVRSGPSAEAGRSNDGVGDRAGDRPYERGGDVADERPVPIGMPPGSVRGRDVSTRGWDVRDGGISEVVSYAAPSADEPSEPSPDLALREPTLDDLLGDAGVRVRSAVGKYARSVTVYRSRAAETSEVDTADEADSTAATNTTDDMSAMDAMSAVDAAPEGFAAARASMTADVEVGPPGDTAPGHTGASDGHTTDGHTTDGAIGGADGIDGDQATGGEPEQQRSTDGGDGPAGAPRGARTGVHGRPRIRFGRRSHDG